MVDVVMLIVAEQVKGQEVGENEADEPPGRPDAENATLSEKPVINVAVTVVEVSLP